MRACDCAVPHQRRRVVLTGGPCAGKTAVLELVRILFCTHVKILPKAAGIVYGGGFPRTNEDDVRRASQRAIFHVQRELEATGTVGSPCVVLCDRSTVDGAAYWPGPGELWTDVGTTIEDEYARYDAVIHLRTPFPETGYDQRNPLRIETPVQARAIDDRIGALWRGHPRVFTVDADVDFLVKASRALEVLRDEVPLCCRLRAMVLS